MKILFSLLIALAVALILVLVFDKQVHAATKGLVFIEVSTGGSEVVSKYLDQDTNTTCYVVQRSGSIWCTPFKMATTTEASIHHWYDK